MSSALFGAAIWQLKQVVAGRDPVPMDTADFWGAPSCNRAASARSAISSSPT
ncbi:MAG: hypothetical protein WDM81_13610 [Rhizomicrobium sp.]